MKFLNFWNFIPQNGSRAEKSLKVESNFQHEITSSTMFFFSKTFYLNLNQHKNLEGLIKNHAKILMYSWVIVQIDKAHRLAALLLPISRLLNRFLECNLFCRHQWRRTILIRNTIAWKFSKIRLFPIISEFTLNPANP